MDDIPDASRAPGPGAGRRAALLEVLAFLFLLVPSLVISLFAGPGGGENVAAKTSGVILRDLSLTALVLFFVWRNREGPARIGWTSRRVWLEILIGVLLFPLFFVVLQYVEDGFRAVGLPGPSGGRPRFLDPTEPGELALAGLLVAVVAVAEETIFRGYLIRRFADITGSRLLAVLIAAAIFSLGHGYEGEAGMATVGVMALILSAVFLWRGSLVAPMTIHFIQDFIGVVLMPILRPGPK